MPSSDIAGCPPQPNLDHSRWWRHRSLVVLNVLLYLCPLLTTFTMGFDGSMFGSLQASDYWQDYFHHPAGTILATLGAAPILGGFIAFPFVYTLSDKMGRRWSMFIGSAFIAVGSGIQAGALNRAMYGLGRGLIGFGQAFCAVCE